MVCPAWIQRKILFGDCDAEKVVYTPRYAHFALEACHEAFGIWLNGSGVSRLFDYGILPPVRAFSLEFLKPATWDDILLIKVSLSELREHSFRISMTAYMSNLPESTEQKDFNKACEKSTLSQKPIFTANLTQVCVCQKTKQVVEIPEQLRRDLN